MSPGTHSRPIHLRWIALTAAVSGLLAACGGGGQGNNARADDTTAATALAHSTSSASTGTKQALALTSRTLIGGVVAAGTPTSLHHVPENTLLVRAYGTLAGNVGPVMQVRVNGNVVGSVEVRATEPTSYLFKVLALKLDDTIDVLFTNDAVVAGQDRNLYVAYLHSGHTVQLPVGPGVVYDKGTGRMAFDGLDTSAGQPAMHWTGSLRFKWPTPAGTGYTTAQASAARLLRQATFGPTTATINRVAQLGPSAWIAEQMALPFTPDFVTHLNTKFARNADHRPGGSRYDYTWVTQRFWATAATNPDQLRKRVAWALHQMMTVSQTDTNLFGQTRAYAQYLDTLNKHAFGNYRQLIEEVALNPAMGIYLSHMRNGKEDAETNRQPDENFARELMQLFTIGLYELNTDGTVRVGTDGNAIETYGNEDVMAMAKVFTGYSWGLPDNQLTETNYKFWSPDFRAPIDLRIDLNLMKAYPTQHSAAAKLLFFGKPQAALIPANFTAADSLRTALDTLFKHPNVGPFVGRQLIQRLVTSAPTPAYVARVAAAFNNSGAGVRGDMAAVVRAVLLDPEASNDSPDASFGKLREPVLNLTTWMRAMEATSASGVYMLVNELDALGQRALFAPSVFGYYRPGYIPPQTVFASRSSTAPEFQIVNEGTTVSWVNKARAMSGSGVGWTGTVTDLSSNYANLAALAAAGNGAALLQELDLLLFAGSMSASLQQAVLDAMGGVQGSDQASHLNRARVAVFLALASPEYLVQR